MNLNNPQILWDLLVEFPELSSKLSIQRQGHLVNEATQLTELPDLRIEAHQFYTQKAFIKAITYLMVRNPPIILYFENHLITLKRKGAEWIAIFYQNPMNFRK